MTFGSMGQLPDDLFSSNPARGTDSCDHNEPGVDFSGLSQIWGDQKDKNIGLVGNTGALADHPAIEKATEDIDKAKIISGARKFMMTGGSRQQLDQFLALNGQDASTDPGIAGLYDELGLIGNVYMRRDTFDRCEDLKTFWHRHKNPFVEYLYTSEACKGCNLNIDRCPKSGLIVKDSIEYSPKMLADYQQKLVLSGKCDSAMAIDTKEALRTAFLAEPRPQTQRSSTRAPNLKPALSHDELTMKAAAEGKRKDDERQQESLMFARETELKPILRFLQEQMLTGSNLDTLHDSFGRKGFSREIVNKYFDEIKDLLGDDLVRLGLKIVPELYPNCESVKKFMTANQNIRPKLAVAFQKCMACNHNNGIGCRLLSCSLIKPDEIAPIDVRQLAICNLKDRSLLSPTEASQLELIELVQPGQGLKRASQLIDGRKSRTPIRVADAGGQLPRSQELRSAGNSSVILQCVKAINLGFAISSIERKLQTKLASETVKVVIDSAVNLAKTIKAEQLDYCMVRKYPLNSDCQIVFAEKCLPCPHNSNKILCKQQGLVFQMDPLIELEYDLEDFNSEAREIQGYFKDSKLEVEINGTPDKKPMDFELDNLGSDMVVGCDNRRNSVDTILSSLRSAELDVEIDSPREGVKPLGVQDLGTSSFDLNM